MELLQNLMLGFSVAFTPENLTYAFIGCLLGTLVDRCTALGYRQMIAGIGDSANLQSIGLHRSLGFRQEGILRGVGLKFGRWVDVVIMHRPLGDPDALPPPA